MCLTLQAYPFIILSLILVDFSVKKSYGQENWAIKPEPTPPYLQLEGVTLIFLQERILFALNSCNKITLRVYNKSTNDVFKPQMATERRMQSLSVHVVFRYLKIDILDEQSLIY